MLEVTGLTAGYGQTRILSGVDLRVAAGERISLLGRNGVGKTTLLRCLIGLLRPWTGTITLDGQGVVGRRPFHIAWSGVGYVPQGRGLFPGLTVAENLYLGTKASRGRKQVPELVFEIFPILRDRANQIAGSLSGGQQQMLAIGRALAGEPKLLLLDEPSEGLQPSLVDSLAEQLRAINARTDVAILLVEQNLDLALSVADRCLVMQKGLVVFEGRPDELRDEEVVARLLAV